MSPSAAGHVVSQMIAGELVSEMDAEVRDIDEDAFRRGKVIAKHYGEMRVPAELSYVQAVKMGGKEDEALVLDDIAAFVSELMEDEPDTYFVMGSGSTVGAIMEYLGLDNTLLGVDVVKAGELVATDVTAASLIEITHGSPCKVVLTGNRWARPYFGARESAVKPSVYSPNWQSKYAGCGYQTKNSSP